LYDRLVQRYAKAWGYRAFRADNGHAVIYELSKIKQSPASEAYIKDIVAMKQGVAEAQDSNFVGFMNKTLGQKADTPTAKSPMPDFMKGAPIAGLDTMGYKAALNFGMKTLNKLTPSQKTKLAIKGEAGVVNWLTSQANKQGLIIADEAEEETQGKFMQEDLEEVQDFLPEVFKDPAIKSWAFVLTDGEPLPKAPVVGPFTVSINPGLPNDDGYANSDWKTLDTLDNLPDAKELAQGLAQRNPKQFVGIWAANGKSAGFYWPGQGWRGLNESVAEGIQQQYLWHGSRQKIDMLEPRQAVDTGGAAGSNQNAIYATSDPKFAITMGLPTAGSDYGHFPNDPQMVLFKGKIRKGEYVYLHKLPFNGPDGKPQFVQGGNTREFHSIPGVTGIKPVKIKKVSVNDYMNLIRLATKKDLYLRKKYMKQGVAEVSSTFGSELTEVFNTQPPSAATWARPIGQWEGMDQFDFVASNGVAYRVDFTDPGIGPDELGPYTFFEPDDEISDQAYDSARFVTFEQTDDNADIIGKQGIEGTGVAAEVFGIVTNVILQYVKKVKPSMLYFQAVESNRQRLYAKMATRIAQTVQWKVKQDGPAHFAIYNPRVIKVAVGTPGVAEQGYGNHPSQRVDPRTGKKYVPPKSPLGQGMAEDVETAMALAIAKLIESQLK
jgi:hypothetical protein